MNTSTTIRSSSRAGVSERRGATIRRSDTGGHREVRGVRLCDAGIVFIKDFKVSSSAASHTSVSSARATRSETPVPVRVVHQPAEAPPPVSPQRTARRRERAGKPAEPVSPSRARVEAESLDKAEDPRAMTPRRLLNRGGSTQRDSSAPPSPAATAARRASNLRLLFGSSHGRCATRHSSVSALRRTMSEISRQAPVPQRAKPIIMQEHRFPPAERFPSPTRHVHPGYGSSSGPLSSEGTTPLRQRSHGMAQTHTPIARMTTAHPNSVRKSREVSAEAVHAPWSDRADSCSAGRAAGEDEDDPNLRALSLDSTSTVPFENS